MKVIEAQGNKGKIAVLVIPFTQAISDAMGFTLSITNSSRYWDYQAVIVVNTDEVRLWRKPEPFRNLLQFSWSAPAAEILGRYATDPGGLARAGESLLSGFAERWLSDLVSHWRHPEGMVPGEAPLSDLGIRFVRDEGPLAQIS